MNICIYTTAANRAFGQREAALTTLIHKFLPGAVLVEDMNSEITYQLPDDRHHTQLFKDLFLALDDNIKNLGFSSYGISDTTLEEVGAVHLCHTTYKILILLLHQLFLSAKMSFLQMELWTHRSRRTSSRGFIPRICCDIKFSTVFTAKCGFYICCDV